MTPMRDRTLFPVLLSLAVAMTACSQTPQQMSSATPPLKNLVFLTRQGCVNTTTMRENLEDALKAMALPNDYQFIDADTLSEPDPRRGYGTPTVLYEGRDLFGMSEPPVPTPPPT